MSWAILSVRHCLKRGIKGRNKSEAPYSRDDARRQRCERLMADLELAISRDGRILLPTPLGCRRRCAPTPDFLRHMANRPLDLAGVNQTQISGQLAQTPYVEHCHPRKLKGQTRLVAKTSTGGSNLARACVLRRKWWTSTTAWLTDGRVMSGVPRETENIRFLIVHLTALASCQAHRTCFGVTGRLSPCVAAHGRFGPSAPHKCRR
jgi:hypothetical protein